MKRFLLALGGFLAVSAVVVCWQWTPILVRYHLWGLCRATEDSRVDWVENVIALQAPVLPALLGGLQREDERACDNLAFALTRIVQSWEPADARRVELAGRLAQAFDGFSTPGQRAVLIAAAETMPLAAAVSPELVTQMAKLAVQAATQTDPVIRTRTLELVKALLDREPAEEVLPGCRAVVLACLGDERAEVRLDALRVARSPRLDLLEKVVPLLDDPSAEVRRAAMVQVGLARDAIADDELLRWLHDPDPDLRDLCEQALRGRGLQDQHLRLGRLLTDRKPENRLRVLDQLRRASDLEPGIWLRRLSHDPDAAVRAAAVRAAAEKPFVNLADRLEQMARDDPSSTVRQLAEYYLRSQKK